MTDDRKRQAPKLPPIVPTYADPCGDDRARSARGTPPASAFEAYTGKPAADAVRQPRHPGEPRIAEHGTTAAERQRRSRAAREEAGGRQVAVMLDHEAAAALAQLCARMECTQTGAIHAALVMLATLGCGDRLAPGQHFTFCGETDHGQTASALCTRCGGPFVPKV